MEFKAEKSEWAEFADFWIMVRWTIGPLLRQKLKLPIGEC